MIDSKDQAEIDKFEAMAAEWWDPAGKLKPLHMMNPVRLGYITAQIAAEFGRDLRAPMPFDGLRILDVGCGGGLLSEPMARLGARVLGADAAAGNIETARVHAAQSRLEIDYRAVTAEELAASGEAFDTVLAFEIVEHVASPQDFIAACGDLVRPGGLLIGSTLNRTPQSFAAAIIGAEYVMRWLPRGTHDWRRFITPDELAAMMSGAGLHVIDRMGMVFNPVSWDWSLSPRNLAVNYAMTARREG